MATNSGNIDLPQCQIEVFEVPGEPWVLGFKLFGERLLAVEGRFNVALAFEDIASKARVLLQNVIDGKSARGTLFSKTRIKLSPRWTGSNKEGELSEMMNEFISDVLKEEIILMFSRMESLGHRSVTEGVILIGLSMDDDEIFNMVKGGRAKIFEAYRREVWEKAEKEISVQTSVRSRTWTKNRQRRALELYDLIYERLEELKRIYRSLGRDRKRWAQVKAENSDLAGVLDLLPNGKLLELSLSCVCRHLGTKSQANVYKQIKIARRERRRLLEGVSIEAVVSRVVDSVLKKGSSITAI